MMRWFTLLGATILSAICYRLGGAAKTGSWYDGLVNTKTRDCGVATIVMLVLLFCSYPIPNLLWRILGIGGSGILTFAASTSYYKPKGQPVRWYNWLTVGFMFGLAILPYALGVGAYTAAALRIIFLALSITLWSVRVNHARNEELGRGALIVASLMVFI